MRSPGSSRRHGLATIEAGSGAEALAVLEREGEIPLVISDIYMPEMDGVTFLREALRRYPDMAVIMLTGVAEVSTAVECLKLGRARLHLQAGADGGSPGAGGQGAGEAPARAPEPVLPAEPREPGPGARPPEQAIADQRRADAGARARGQGRLHQRPLQPGEPLRREDRGAARATPASAWSTSASAASCTTSARSAPARTS